MMDAPPLNTSVESVLDISWPLPVWASIVITAVLIAFVGWIYASERGLASSRVRAGLGLLRFLLLAMVLWMLAGWSWLRFKSDQPELVIVIDRSASMETRDVPLDRGSFSKPQEQTRFELAKALFEQLDARSSQALASQYQLKWFAVSDNAQPLTVDLREERPLFAGLAATGSESRLGDALGRLIDRQAGRGTAAIVFVSDGITTSGTSLMDAAQKARRAAIPLHTVVVGRQFVQPDLRLVDLLVDREVYFGDEVSAEVSVVASDIPATTATITLTDASNQRVLDRATLELSPDRHQQQVRLRFVPDRSGEIPLELSVTAVKGETDESNNKLQAKVVVQDKSIRVLMVFQTASYEFRFLKNLLERSTQEAESKTSSFELLSVLQDADPTYVEQDATALRLVPSSPAALNEVDVFVFGEFDPNLVSRSSQQAIFDAVTNGGAGCIFVYGSGSPAVELQNWPLEKLLPIELATTAGALAPLDSGVFRWQPTQLGTTALPMQLASSPAESLKVWQQLPTFNLTCRIEGIRSGAQVLANAIDAQSGDTRPLLITQFAGAGRTALQATDETYSWTSFAGSDVYHQRYWGQMLRWLSRGKLNRGSQASELSVEPKQARLGQPIRFQVTLGSEAAGSQLPDTVELSLEGADGQRRGLSLPRGGGDGAIYQANVTDLAPGNYRALLLRPTEAEPPNAEFSVTAPPGEQANLRADVEAMQFAANHSRGRFYKSENAEQLFENLPPGKPTRLGTLPPIPVWNSHWIALLFVLLITCEWLLRRHVRML